MERTTGLTMKEDKLLFDLPPTDLVAAEKKFRERDPIWTGCKAKLIERYLFYFVQITYHGTYIDAFAGPQEVDQQETWSAKLVLESRPRWLRNFYLFDSNASQIKRLRSMYAGQPLPDAAKREPVRKVRIYRADFNQKISQVLAENPISEREATFCLLDQRTFECDWVSVETVANHKKAGNKIELFYFFPEGWLNRSAAGLADKPAKLKRWWGSDTWSELMTLQGATRAQYVSQRFRDALNYRHVYPFPIYEKKDQGGRVMYYMIHASDHDDAPVLMNRAYGKALDIKETDEQMDLLRESILSAPMPASMSSSEEAKAKDKVE